MTLSLSLSLSRLAPRSCVLAYPPALFFLFILSIFRKIDDSLSLRSVTGEGVGDHLPDGLDHLGGGFLTLLRALVAAALLAAAGLMSLIIHVFRLFCLFCLFSEK